MTDAAFTLPFSENDLAKIGYLVTLWNEVELLLNFSIVAALQVDVDAAAAIFGSTTVNHRLTILSKVGPARFKDRPGMQSLLDECINDTNQLSTYRNEIVHAKWAQGSHLTDPKKGWNKLNSKKPVDFDIIDAKIEQIAVLTNKFAVIEYALLKGYVEDNGLNISSEPPAWRDRFSPKIPLD